ncbi:MAG: dihydroneopterin aldolase [Chloroflexi bacterium]|nr:dihydroneopterin aldolase [Chloroflexota bacterium]
MSEHPDRLSLLGMRFMARHGVLGHEKVEPQPFEVDLVLHADLDTPAASDDLADTIDYGTLLDTVTGVVTGRSFNLIEALAGAIAHDVLESTDPALVSAVEVRVRKPRAPIDGDLDTVEVALLRRRSQVG